MGVHKVCFFNSALTWGGGEKWHFQMACQFLNRGLQVVVAANPRGLLYKKCKERGVEVFGVQLDNLSFLDPVLILRLRGLLRKHQFDALILNSSPELKAAGIAAKMAGVPRIVYRRGLDAPVRDRFFTRFLFNRVLNGIIVNSKATLRQLSEHDPSFVNPEIIKVIYNGLDLSEYDDDALLPDIERRPSAVILGTLGRLVPQKGHHFLIEVAEKLKQKGIDFKLYIAGTGVLGKELEGLAEERGLKKEIEFMGFVHDVPAFLNSIDIYLHTALWEGFGYSIAEAMACSKPVIAFNSSSNPELIEEGETGFLIEEADTEAFARQIEVLASESTKRLQMGEKGRKRVENEFTIEKSSVELLAFLQESG